MKVHSWGVLFPVRLYTTASRSLCALFTSFAVRRLCASVDILPACMIVVSQLFSC